MSFPLTSDTRWSPYQRVVPKMDDTESRKKMSLQQRELDLERRELAFDIYQANRKDQEPESEELDRKELELVDRRIGLQTLELEYEKREFNLAKKEARLASRKAEQDKQTDAQILHLALSGINWPADKTSDEVDFEKKGDLNALQRYRHDRYFFKLYLNGTCDPLEGFLATEAKLRETAQKELRLKEEMQREFREDLQQELSALAREYWLLERKWWKCRRLFPEGPLTRGFDLWRSDPRWYLHRTLMDDCVGNGGCCGRGCGCCVDRKLDMSRKLAVGHCTFECSCCQQARGFEPTEEEKEDIEMQFETSDVLIQDPPYLNAEFDDVDSEDEISDESEDPQDPHHRRVSLASIWGLVDGNNENPFDLIKVPPLQGNVLATVQFEGNDETFSLIDGKDKASMVPETGMFEW